MSKSNKWMSGFLVTALALGVGSAAWAHGGGGPGGHGPGGPGPRPGLMRPAAPHARGLLSQLVFPCQAACFDTDRTCHETADDAALTCVTAACATEIQAAQTACATDSASEDCRDAFAALKTCADSCLDTRDTAITACRDAAKTCRDACTAE